jgi:hypothetical protein
MIEFIIALLVFIVVNGGVSGLPSTQSDVAMVTCQVGQVDK